MPPPLAALRAPPDFLAPDEDFWTLTGALAKDGLPGSQVPRASWRQLGELLLCLRHRADDEVTVERFQRWIPLVARYSFQTSRLAYGSNL